MTDGGIIGRKTLDHSVPSTILSVLPRQGVKNMNE